MGYPITGVILAGGRNSRFSGQNKAFITIFQKTVLEHILDAFSGLFEEILLITKSPMDYLRYDVTIATDLFSASSSLAGVHAGLFYSKTPFTFFTACDTPFIKKEMIRLILDHVAPDCHAVIPETKAGLEPLCAVYAKASLQRIEAHIRQDRLKILRVFSRKRVIRIREKTLKVKDPELISFFNINTPADLERAKRLTKPTARQVQPALAV